MRGIQYTIINTVNVDISALLNLRASKPYVTFSHGHIFTHLVSISVCPIMIHFFITLYFCTSRALLEIRKNMYCAKMYTFKVK